MTSADPADLRCPDISDSDIYEAMKEIPGYLDITPSDLKEIYRHAFRHALERVSRPVKAATIMTRSCPSRPGGHAAPGCRRTLWPAGGSPACRSSTRPTGWPGSSPEGTSSVRMGAPDAAHVMGIVAACLAGQSVRRPCRSADRDGRGHHGDARRHRSRRRLDARDHRDLLRAAYQPGARSSTLAAGSPASSRAPTSSARRPPPRE